jgi:hypothetical protein
VLPPLPRRPGQGLTPAELAEIDRRLAAVGEELLELAAQVALACGFGTRSPFHKPAGRLATARSHVGGARTLLRELWTQEPDEDVWVRGVFADSRAGGPGPGIE